jgi:hypothetical protein
MTRERGGGRIVVCTSTTFRSSLHSLASDENGGT